LFGAVVTIVKLRILSPADERQVSHRKESVEIEEQLLDEIFRHKRVHYLFYS